MQVTVYPGKAEGSINAPSSKSITQRAYAGALLHHGTTIIKNAGQSNDELTALNIIQQLGASILSKSTDTNQIVIHSNGLNPTSKIISCNESGLSGRLFTPIAAIFKGQITVDGNGSLLSRPLREFELFKKLGKQLSSFNGFLPITMEGELGVQDITIDGSNTSQLLSGLLFAYCYSATVPTTIKVKNLASKPYIDLTMDMLEQFGRKVSNIGYHTFSITPAIFVNKDTVEITVEGDWSSAAFFLVAGAISGSITITNLTPTSKQADRAILDVLKSAGAIIAQTENSINILQGKLTAFDFDATDAPDLFPILSILAACCEGESTIKGVQRLFHKESNRAESIAEMLESFDIPYSMENDILCISGVERLRGTVIDSYNDHRIVMAASIGALKSSSPVDIIDAAAVNKSYPNFFKDLAFCGVKIEIK